jgi:hypothetical protein
MKPDKKQSSPSDEKKLAKDKRLNRDQSELTLDEPEAAAAYNARIEGKVREEQERAVASELEAPSAADSGKTEAALPDGDGKEEFGPIAKTSGESAPVTRRKEKEAAAAKSMEKLDKIGKIVAIVVLPIVIGGVILTMFRSSGGAHQPSIKRKPSVPMQGELLQVTDASSGWRTRQNDDRVTTVSEVITKRPVSPNRLPTVTLKLQSTKPLAYLRVLFFDETGRIAGDPRLVKIENGKLSPATSGSTAEKVLGSDECQITASSGFINDSYLQDYFAGPARRWSVEISESSDYRARGSEWKELDTFAIKDVSL